MTVFKDIVATVGTYEKDGETKYINRKVGCSLFRMIAGKLSSLMRVLPPRGFRVVLTMVKFGCLSLTNVLILALLLPGVGGVLATLAALKTTI